MSTGADITDEFFIPAGTGRRLAALFQRRRGGAATAEAGQTLVIMLHGFPSPGMKTQEDVFGRIEEMLYREGICSLRFDFSGCGESPGKPEEFDLISAGKDLHAALDWARGKRFTRFFFIGEGLGATVAAMAAETEGLRGLVLLWPMLDINGTSFTKIMPQLGDPERVKKGYIRINGQKAGILFLKQLRDLNIVRHIEKITVPVLIQHGDADTESDLDTQADLFRDEAPDLRRLEVTTYQGGGHGLLKANERQTLLFHIGQFVKRYL